MDRKAEYHALTDNVNPAAINEEAEFDEEDLPGHHSNVTIPRHFPRPHRRKQNAGDGGLAVTSSFGFPRH